MEKDRFFLFAVAGMFALSQDGALSVFGFYPPLLILVGAILSPSDMALLCAWR